MIGRAASVVALALTIFSAPFVAGAQLPAKVPRIGYLGPVSPTSGAYLLESFRQGLRERGYTEGQNIFIDYRWAEGRADRLHSSAKELVQLSPDAIVTYNNAAVVALQRATRTIPIVVANMGDPVGSGLVVSLARPGRNVTGLSGLAEEVSRKWLELLREAVPRITRVAVLAVAQSPVHDRMRLEIEGAATALKIAVQRQDVTGPDEVEDAVASLVKGGAQGLIVLPHAVTNARRSQIANLATKNRLAGMYPDGQYVEAGGLISYAANFSDLHRRAATYVDRILKGAKPADLPVEQPTKYELVINLKAAKVLRVTIPQSLMLRADRIVE